MYKQVQKNESNCDNEENNQHQSDIKQASFNFFKSMVGSGILALPYAIHYCGYGWGIILLIMLAYCSAYSITLLIKVADSQENVNILYPQLGQKIAGQTVKILIEIFLFVIQSGASISYIIIFHRFLSEAFNNANILFDDIYIAILSFIVLFSLSFCRDFHSLSISSIFGSALSIFALIYITTKNLCCIIEVPYYDQAFLSSGIPNFFGVAVLAFEGAGTVFHIRTSMIEPDKFTKVYRYGTYFVAILYISFGVINLLTYGPNIQQIALMNLKYNIWLDYGAKIGYSFSILLTYPVQIFPCYSVTEGILKAIFIKKRPDPSIDQINYNYEEINQKQNSMIMYSSRVIVFTIMFFIAYKVKQFTSFLNLIGGFSGIALQFIFPNLFYLIYFKDSSNTQKMINWIYIIFGILSSILVVYNSIQKLGHTE